MSRSGKGPLRVTQTAIRTNTPEERTTAADSIIIGRDIINRGYRDLLVKIPLNLMETITISTRMSEIIR
jgi:hypothetical protein